MIETHQQMEWVHRAVCSACGCSGPGARTAEAAQFLAVICEWDATNGRCLSCKKLRAGRKDPSKRKRVAK